MLRVTSLASETFPDSSVSNGLAWDSFEVRLLAGGRPMLEARGLTKYYGSVLAVQSIDFTLEPGQVLGYLGPNGSGKSTTVKCSSAYWNQPMDKFFSTARTSSKI